MNMKLETMIRRRDALKKKLHDSKYHYQGNIAVPASLSTYWSNLEFRISQWNCKIKDAIENSPEAKALEDLKAKAGV